MALAGTAAGLSVIDCAQPSTLHSSASPPMAKWDDSWTRRLGSHRTVFDIAEMEATPGVGQIPPVMDAYHDVLGTSDSDMGFVVVIRHLAAPLLLNDALWEQHEVGTSLKHKDPKTSAPYKYNPVRPLIEMVQSRGVVVLGCHSATVGFAAMAAQRARRNRDEVEREVLAGLLPGVTLLPNGLYALARAQDAGCGFMR